MTERKKRRLWPYGLALLLLGAGSMIAIDGWMTRSASPFIYRNISKTPAKKAALLLGTAKYVRNGRKNYFYLYRIRAAAKLFKSGKVKAIIVSGDNGTRQYDEPTMMMEDLVRAGVPRRYIRLDYAGFRTLDSVVRAEAIFDVTEYIIVSQRFHLERALFIAQAKGHKAIGYIAKDLPNTAAAYRMKFREYLARAKAFLDLYVLGTEPKFYGPKVTVYYR